MSVRPVLPLFAIVTLMTLSACSSYQGDWPKLAPNDDSDLALQEAELNSASDDQNSENETNTIVPMTTAGGAALATHDAELNQAQAKFANLIERYTQQHNKVQEARSNTGQSTSRSSSDWATTQLELTRLNQITTEIKTLRTNVAQTTADLAAMAAKGIAVTAILQKAGRLVDTIDSKLNTADVYRREVNMDLSESQRP